MLSTIPKVDHPSLPESDVQGYVLDAIQRGWCRSAQHSTAAGQYALTTPNYNEIILAKVSSNRECWNIYYTGCDFSKWGHKIAESLYALNHFVREAALACGDTWGQETFSVRLNNNQYAGNVARLAGLIGSKPIEAVFDPYLCNKSLLTLTELASLGGFTFAPGLRLLGSAAKIGGSTPQLTKHFVDGWFGERKVNGGAVRIAPDKPHRRFLLLGSGHSLIVGCSLNSIDKDETAHLEPDSDDRAFFDSQWNAAQPLT